MRIAPSVDELTCDNSWLCIINPLDDTDANGKHMAPIICAFLAVALTVPPNGLAFSCRERAGSECQKINDLAREAVNCNAGLGRARYAALGRGIFGNAP